MVKLSIYMDDGRVFEYEVADAMKGREHAAAVLKSGYRHTPEGSADLEWYPAHRILKVKVVGAGESTAYHDTVRAT